MNTEQQKALALAQAKRKRAEAEGSSVGPEAKNGAFEGFGQAFWQGIDQPLESMGTTAEVLGFKDTGKVLKDATQGVEGYESASSKFMNGDFFGFDPKYLPKAITEQAGQFAGSLASRAAGAAIGTAGGAVVGSVAPGVGTATGATAGGVTGAFAGPAIFEAAQQFGPVAISRARNNGREVPNTEDWIAAGATSAVAGALNALAPGASGLGKRAAIEGATEAGQSAVQQVGETAGTDAGLNVDLKQAVGEGIIGAGSAAAVDTSIEGAKQVYDNTVPKRTDNENYSNDDVRLAERLQAAAGNQPENLGNVTTTSSNEGAQSYAKAVLGDLRVEIGEAADGLKALAKYNNSAAARKAVKRAVKNSGNLKKTITDENINAIEDHFGDEPDARRLVSLLRQEQRLLPMTESMGDMGGIAKYTRKLDLTDGRNGGGFVGISLGVAGLGALGGGTVVNRAARLIDGLTNRRSTIKRFVDSVNKTGRKSTLISGQTAEEKVASLKEAARQAAEAQARKEALGRQAEQQFERDQASDLRKIATADQRSVEALAKYNQDVPDGNKPVASLDQSKGSGNWQGKIDAQARSQMWDTGEIPANDPYYEGYRRWKQATGMNPSDTLDVLEQLEREGKVPPNTSQRFAENIYSFKKDKSVPGIQRMVQERGNPGYVADFSEKADTAIRKLDAATNKPGKSNSNYKKAEGQRRATNVVAQIEGSAASISPQVQRALLNLKHAMDSQQVTRDQRFALMDETLVQLFQNPVERDLWTKTFTPLADIGNEQPIKSKYENDEEVKAEELDQKIEKAKKASKKKKNKKSADVVADPVQLELDLRPVETTAERALAKLTGDPTPQAEPEETSDLASEAEQAQEPTLDSPKQTANRKGLAKRAVERISHIEGMVNLARDRGQALYDLMERLPKSTEGRVEKLVLELATDQLTANMLIDSYGSRFDLPGLVAAKEVMKVLNDWESRGLVKLVRQYNNNKLKVDGVYVQDENGQDLSVLSVEAVSPDLIDALETAKAVNFVSSMVNPEGPEDAYTPDRLTEGPHQAFKDIAPENIDGTFKPILDFLNDLRSMQFSIHPAMLDQIETALMEAKGDKLGIIARELNPVTDSYTVVNKKTGKVSKKTDRDHGPWRTVSQMLYSLGQKDERKLGGTLFRQEWTAGRNLRVYAKNGLMTSHGGDIMKGLMRTDQKYKVGSTKGLDFMFHSFGNLLGFDKKSPKTRREAVLREGVAEALIDFANNPFGQYTLQSSKGNEKPITKILDDGEGFFQVLNVAHEVKSMVEWAKARHPKLAAAKPGSILVNPKVREDLAANYETDFIVQLDASNNAYQLSGLVMGYHKVLQATGLMPREGVSNPDEADASDIYVEPAKDVVARIPDLAAVGFPDSFVRKLFKKAIGTYLYAAEFNSRKESFSDVLGDLAFKRGVNIVGIGGDGLIEMPESMVEGLSSPEGFTLQRTKYSIAEDTSKVEAVTLKVIPETIKTANGESTVWRRARKGKNGFVAFGGKYETQAEAMRSIYEQDLYTRMNRELVREFETRYPGVREYLNFAGKVTQMMRDRGGNSVTTVKVPTPDGMTLEYSLKEVDQYTGFDTQFTDSKGEVTPIRLGVKSGDVKFKGRGLAAFMTHQLDSYVLRETYRRMKEKGIKSFNPIHDSFGFHPSDAERGQATALEVMQELGSADYNIFLQILEANGIRLEDFIAAGGILPQRHDVAPQPAQRIPTALS